MIIMSGVIEQSIRGRCRYLERRESISIRGRAICWVESVISMMMMVMIKLCRRWIRRWWGESRCSGMMVKMVSVSVCRCAKLSVLVRWRRRRSIWVWIGCRIWQTVVVCVWRWRRWRRVVAYDRFARLCKACTRLTLDWRRLVFDCREHRCWCGWRWRRRWRRWWVLLLHFVHANVFT